MDIASGLTYVSGLVQDNKNFYKTTFESRHVKYKIDDVYPL